MSEEKKGSEVRMWVGLILAVFIVGVVSWLVTNWDEASQRKVEIKYADNCVETYINEELVTDECTLGRELEQKAVEREMRGMQQWNIPLTNLT